MPLAYQWLPWMTKVYDIQVGPIVGKIHPPLTKYLCLSSLVSSIEDDGVI